MDGAVGAAGERGAQDLLRLGRAGTDGANVLDAAGRALLLADQDGLLNREVVKRVDAVLDAGRLDTGLRLVDADLDLWLLRIAVSELGNVAIWPIGRGIWRRGARTA